MHCSRKQRASNATDNFLTEGNDETRPPLALLLCQSESFREELVVLSVWLHELFRSGFSLSLSISLVSRSNTFRSESRSWKTYATRALDIFVEFWIPFCNDEHFSMSNLSVCLAAPPI